LLPAVCGEVDAERSPAARWELLLRGVCAANIFDLGAAHTTALYHEVRPHGAGALASCELRAAQVHAICAC
jgi:hypothetical protein